MTAEKDMELAREIVEVNRGVAGGIGTPVYLASLERDIASALASARREALEEAAQWHDDEADRAMARNHAGSSNGERRHNRTIAELNRAYAVAIRALIEKDWAMTDLRERLGKLRADAEDEGRRFKNVLLSADKVLALLDVAEAALPFKERAMLRHMPELDAALSRLSTATGGQHE